MCPSPRRTADQAPVLHAEDLTARYAGQHQPALVNVSLSLARGERLLLVGPNGAGKSTIIRVFAGLMRATAGQALVQGLPPRQARRLVGVVSHSTYLYGELTPLENLRLYAELYDVARPAQRAWELLERLGLSQVAYAPVGRLSRGQQQRVTLARALLHDPPLLLLDEPDTGLDAAAWRILTELVASGDRTILLTTHNLPAGLELATQVSVLAHGGVVHQRQVGGAPDATELNAMLQQLARA